MNTEDLKKLAGKRVGPHPQNELPWQLDAKDKKLVDAAGCEIMAYSGWNMEYIAVASAFYEAVHNKLEEGA